VKHFVSKRDSEETRDDDIGSPDKPPRECDDEACVRQCAPLFCVPLYLSVCLNLSFRLFVCLSILLHRFLSICQSVSLCFCLSVCLSVYLLACLHFVFVSVPHHTYARSLRGNKNVLLEDGCATASRRGARWQRLVRGCICQLRTAHQYFAFVAVVSRSLLHRLK
jgi:hypothetical protein